MGCGTEERLIAACLGTDDIAPRLILADWWEERGDERAELIRLVCDTRKGLHETPVRDRVNELNEKMPAWNHCLADLRRRCDAPYIAAIDVGWPRCDACADGMTIYATTGPHALSATLPCSACHGTGRIGKLWRECPDCKGKGYGDLIGYIEPRCDRCNGYGVLLEVLIEYPPSPAYVWKFEWVESPLAPYYRWLKVIYDHRSEQVRRGDLKGIL